MTRSSHPHRVHAVATVLGALLIVQSAYLWVDSSPSLFYVGNVFAHFFGGLAIAALVLWSGVRALRTLGRARHRATAVAGFALAAFVVSVGSALALAKLHNTRATSWLLDLHIGSALTAVIATLLTMALMLRGRTLTEEPAAESPEPGRTKRIPGDRIDLLAVNVAFQALATAVLLAAAGGVVWPLLRSGAGTSSEVMNPARAPLDMAAEAMGGADGPFFPSSAETSTGGRIPSDFFMTSEACARCHGDIYEQWRGSAHHFSSFNNQWYRKSIEYMQEVNSIQSSKWCAGCHDHAVLFNGMMDDPVETIIGTKEAHTGLGCNSCHAITKVKGTMGQGGFYIEYPPLHDLATSDNPALRWLHDFAVQLDPGPHRRVFLKPFHRQQTSEFCSSCHKVHLDVPVNNYRWFRGFNEYDNWQASGVSGYGARSFYYPPEPRGCADCHMPLVPSSDDGNIAGNVHDHSFLAANTAVPSANLDEHQLARTIDFVQRHQVTVDVFAVTPARTVTPTRIAHASDPPQLQTAFGVGEEAAMPVGRAGARGGGAPRELAPIQAPLSEAPARVRRGETVFVEVVVRTRGVGHFFPGGTIDAFDVWLELRARDANGRTIYWSGVVHDGGRGPVDPGAHFYGARMVDAHGNRIDKRNAWATRAVVWVNLIPPGAADVAHFELTIPEDCGDSIELEARLNYRKFSTANTAFSFAGRPAAGEPPASGPGVERVTPHYDDRQHVIGGVAEDVSAAVREIPTLPTVVVHRDSAVLRVIDDGADESDPWSGSPTIHPGDWERWNDYGIGLLRQGDLQGARRAFTSVTAAVPDDADGFVNLARVAIREGLLDEAEQALDRALALAPNLAKSHYFSGLVLKEQGRYPEALAAFRRAAAQYPRDRVVRNAIGRVLFLQRRYEEAARELEQVLAIDPEDVAAHYTLMLVYKGLGRLAAADNERQLYERFKADEDAEILLGPYLRAHPEDNRMRQPIHVQSNVAPEVLAREIAIRESQGDPHTVLRGEAEAYARRLVERGARMIDAGQGAERYEGPANTDFLEEPGLGDLSSTAAGEARP